VYFYGTRGKAAYIKKVNDFVYLKWCRESKIPNFLYKKIIGSSRIPNQSLAASLVLWTGFDKRKYTKSKYDESMS
jgi:hypothetical protein